MKQSLINFFALIIMSVGVFAEAKSPEEKLAELNIEIPTASTPIANYVNAVTIDNLIYLSGKGPELPKGGLIKGKLGKNLSIKQGQAAARLTAINLIGVLKHELDDLSRVEKIVKLNGLVNSTPDFTRHPEVINGASDLLVQIFGERIGKHARVAAGVNSLPFGIPVEIDLIVKFKK